MKKFLSMFLISIFVFSLFQVAEASGTNRSIKVNSKIIDEIEEKNEVDCFNFYLSKAGSVQVDFEFDVLGKYTVKLIDLDTEKTIQTTYFDSSVNTTSGRYKKSSNKIRLNKGDYQIKISASSWYFSDEEYEFVVNYDAEYSDKYEKEPNNDAKNSMVIDYNQSIVGNLESGSDVDYYMVELPYSGVLYTELTFNIDAGYSVYVYEENNGKLKSIQSNSYRAKLTQNGDTYFDSSEKLRVPEGNYYFKISSGWSNFSNKDYTFRVRYVANSYGNYEEEYNNEAKNATSILTDVEYVGNMSSRSDKDYYVVDIWDDKDVTVEMNIPENATYSVTTYKEENGDLSKIKSEKFKNKDIVGKVSGEAQSLKYGRYYFLVTALDYSNMDYTISISTKKSNVIILEINNPYMMVNGNSILIDGYRGTTPVILNGRTMLPAKAIIETLGGTVFWNEASKEVILNLDGNTIKLTLNSNVSYVNGVVKYLDVPATSINGRTMIPVKFVMDNFGASVIWNGTTGAVTITY